MVDLSNQEVDKVGKLTAENPWGTAEELVLLAFQFPLKLLVEWTVLLAQQSTTNQQTDIYKLCLQIMPH